MQSTSASWTPESLVDDLGPPSSYLTLSRGLAVYSSDGERLGRVEHVLAEPKIDIFDGVVIDRSRLPGGHRFVDAEQVEEIFERGLVLKVTAAAAAQLPIPSAESGSVAEAADRAEVELERKLRSAWERISGRG
jgi:hypothetical protein